MTPLLLGVIVFFIGGIVQGCMGFGLAMVAVPPLLMVLPATTIVPTLTVLSLFNTTAMTWHLKKDVRPNIVAPLVVGSLVGLPAGIYLLTTMDGPAFKAGVGVLMIALAAILLSGWSMSGRHSKWGLYPAGALGGFFAGSISIGGPPVILFLTSLGISKETFRANMVAYFTCSSSFAILGFVIAGVLTRDVLIYSAGTLPAVMLGTFLGVKASTRIPQEVFRRLTLAGVMVMGLVLTIRSLLEMTG